MKKILLMSILFASSTSYSLDCNVEFEKTNYCEKKVNTGFHLGYFAIKVATLGLLDPQKQEAESIKNSCELEKKGELIFKEKCGHKPKYKS